jgi:hypothetical protein
MKSLLLVSLILLNTHIIASGRGDITISAKEYTKDKDNQNNSLLTLKASVEENIEWSWLNFTTSLSGKVDGSDNRNSYFNINEIYARFTGPFYSRVHIGAKTYIWSKMEAFHPLNIVNSRIIDSDIEDFEKKGEPSIVFENDTILGNIKAYYFPYFIKPFYPSKNNRITNGVRPVDTYVVYNSEINKEYRQDQFGLSLDKQFDDFELFLFVMSHVDRNSPILGWHEWNTLFGNNIPEGSLGAYYHKTLDYGLGGTFFFGEHTFKLEMVHNNYDDNQTLFLQTSGLVNIQDRTTVAVGHEYIYAWENGYESTFFTEYEYVFGNDITDANKGIFQNDIFIGHRLSFNDIQSKELQLGFFYDLERDSEWMLLVTYQQRLNDFWMLKMNYRSFNYSEEDNLGLYILDGDDEVTISLKRSF